MKNKISTLYILLSALAILGCRKEADTSGSTATNSTATTSSTATTAASSSTVNSSSTVATSTTWPTTSGTTTSTSSSSSGTTTSSSTTGTTGNVVDPWNKVIFWSGGPGTAGQYFVVTLDGQTSDPISYYYQTSYQLGAGNGCAWQSPTRLDGSGAVASYRVMAGTYTYSAVNYLGVTKTGTVVVKNHMDADGTIHGCYPIKLF